MLLTGLFVHPVKSLAAVPVGEVGIERWGPVGDRRWMLVDEAGTLLSQRQEPRLGQIGARLPEPGLLVVEAPGAAALKVAEPREPLVPVKLFDLSFEAVDAGEAAAEWFRAVLGRRARLVYLDRVERRPLGIPTSFADGYPLLLTSTSSLEALNGLVVGDPVPMTRFRPNLVVTGAEAWAETGWRRILVGDVQFDVVQQCGRCVVTTLDQETGARRGPEPLRALGRHRKFGRTLGFGMQLAPVGALGTVRVGDPVTVLDGGPVPDPD